MKTVAVHVLVGNFRSERSLVVISLSKFQREFRSVVSKILHKTLTGLAGKEVASKEERWLEETDEVRDVFRGKQPRRGLYKHQWKSSGTVLPTFLFLSSPSLSLFVSHVNLLFSGSPRKFRRVKNQRIKRHSLLLSASGKFIILFKFIRFQKITRKFQSNGRLLLFISPPLYRFFFFFFLF